MSDGDGDFDLFIGARNIPGSYGLIPSSILLENIGNGKFKEVTASKAPALLKAGMVTDAVWVNLNGDSRPELILAGDWMPIRIFSFQKEILTPQADLPESEGWWNCLKIADIDRNGKPDIIAGNFGLNSNIKADSSHPARLFTADFDQNGQTECIPVFYKPDGKAYPYYLKDEMESQLPGLKKKFLQYKDYAGKPIEAIFNSEQLKMATVLSVKETRSSVFYNLGNGKFQKVPLPLAAQLSPVGAIAVVDCNADGLPDLQLGGNFFGWKPQTGRLDASYGTTLVQTYNGWENYLPKYSGFFVKGEVRDISPIRLSGGGTGLVVSRNNASFVLFRAIKRGSSLGTK
ncbi:MAG: VCBS repeat-containing protein [Chitinophagia bacterium]|nr:VCBS repeat-containing protein [Chitinophagia bacterium]